MGVPDVESAQVSDGPAGATRLCRGLQQRCPLLNDPVVVMPDPSEPRGSSDEELVEISAPLGWIALDQRQVLRCEADRTENPEYVSRTREHCPVEPGAVRSAALELDFDHALSVVPNYRNSDDRSFPTRPDQWRVGGYAMTGESRGVRDGLKQIGLALAIRTDECGYPGSQRHVDVRVRPKVDELDPRNTHPSPVSGWRLVLVGVRGRLRARLGRGCVGGRCRYRMAAELAAQRGNHPHGRRILLPGGESREQRGRDRRQWYGMVDRCLDGPTALAGVFYVTADPRQVGVCVERAIEQLEQPRTDDRALTPGLKDRWDVLNDF